jgi:hypothetical protein
MADDITTDSWDPTQYDFDVRPSDVLFGEILGPDGQPLEKKQERVAVIRTSDRINFRRCRRRWGWNSHLRGNIGPKQNAAPLWMGSGFHFALEDCHGANHYGHPAEAFLAYKEATIRASRRDMTRLPADIQELTDLSVGMLKYYWDEWMISRDPLQTYFHNGVPQVEVNFRVEVPWEAGRYGYDRVVYSGTLDRVSIDEHGQLWIVEYKTAKSIQTLHYANDSQVSTYCWAGNLLYGRPIAGVIYQQHRKDIPAAPKILASGRLSTDKRQLITHRSLRSYIKNIYGEVRKAPQDYVDMLNWMATQEDMDSDKFVRRDKIRRNLHQCEAEAVKILMEVEEMLNPDLPLYPNPDRTCAFMCPFNGACVSLDDGSDWEYELDILMAPRDKEYDQWRKKLELPQTQFMLEGRT